MAHLFSGNARTFAAMLFGGAAVGLVAIAPQFMSQADARPITIEAPKGAPLSFADLIESVSPAVVSVNVVSERQSGRLADLDQFFEQFRGLPGFEEFRRRQEEAPPREARSLGSGFFISDEGFIVTNNHVVANATEIEVVLSDGTSLQAELVGTDPQTDLAVIKTIEDDTYPYVEFASADEMRVGDWVVALGNPFGLQSTATAGIISADGRQIGGDSPYTDFLQIDAPINRGNSGGPTFDLNGRVIGVNTAIFSPSGGSVGIGFAIPADLAVQVTDQLIRTGRVSRGWLGVSIQDVTEDMADALSLASNDGAIVSDLLADGPALRSGIRRGDIIVEINGSEVEDATDVTRKVGGLLAGSQNEFVVLRDGERTPVTVTVGERPSDPNAVPAAGSQAPDLAPDGELWGLGVELSALDDDARTNLGLSDDEAGVLVTGVDPDSPLRDIGIVRPGVAILEVNGSEVSSGEDFQSAIDAARSQGKEQVLLAVRAGTRTLFATADITEEE